MEVNIGFILAAGIGSRMGPIGALVPKPLWPVFDKTLIDLQISYVKSLGIDNIYINIHHQADLIKAYLLEYHPEIHILFEKELLGIGGAIHNLARQKNIHYSGNVLIVNSDQFLMMNKSYVDESAKYLKDCPAVLFNKKVLNSDLFGAVDVQENLLKALIPNKDLPRVGTSVTYSGNSLVNLEKLSPTLGISHFFDTVADYKSKSIYTREVSDNDYWDFGTLKRYFESLFRVFHTPKSDPFIKFLHRFESINFKHLNYDLESYRASEKKILNFAKQEFKINGNDNIIEYQKIKTDLFAQAF